MTSSKCQVAFLGVGAAAQPYLDALARRADVVLTAVCDVDRRAAEQTAAGWGAAVVPHAEGMFDSAPPDALWICLPPHLQTSAVQQAAQRRIPFFIVPPGATDFSGA